MHKFIKDVNHVYVADHVCVCFRIFPLHLSMHVYDNLCRMASMTSAPGNCHGGVPYWRGPLAPPWRPKEVQDFNSTEPFP